MHQLTDDLAKLVEFGARVAEAIDRVCLGRPAGALDPFERFSQAEIPESRSQIATASTRWLAALLTMHGGIAAAVRRGDLEAVIIRCDAIEAHYGTHVGALLAPGFTAEDLMRACADLFVVGDALAALANLRQLAVSLAQAGDSIPH